MHWTRRDCPVCISAAICAAPVMRDVRRRMFDSLTTKEIVRFLIPSALGCLSYALTTLAARFISPVPRHIYIGRWVFLAAFILLIWILYLPSTAITFSGSRERYYSMGGDARGMGTFYGMHTTWIWCIVALLKQPKNAMRTPPNERPGVD